MPPPPAHTTMVPARTRRSTESSSTIRRGSGDGTRRRQRSPSGPTTQPRRAARSVAVRSSVPIPIGLVGASNAGSRRSTSTWVNRVTTRSVDDGVRELDRQQVADLALGLGVEDIEPRLAVRRRVLRAARRPTCGPLPWVTTRSAATANPASEAAARRDVGDLVGEVGSFAASEQRVAADRRDDQRADALASHVSTDGARTLRSVGSPWSA